MKPIAGFTVKKLYFVSLPILVLFVFAAHGGDARAAVFPAAEMDLKLDFSAAASAGTEQMREPIARSDSRRTSIPVKTWRSRFGDDYKRELRCLSLNIYFEARSEPRIGMLAVAAVTLNRVGHPSFPDTICGVVWQGAKLGQNRCQFSWACDGKSDRPTDARAWKTARNMARITLAYGLADPTVGALWYHADYVQPKWASVKTLVARIGRHIYYREPLSVPRYDRDAS